MLSSVTGSGKSQSLKDRAFAAKYTFSGDILAKVIFKATTEEIVAPKAKHIEYLIASTNDANISIPQTANLLLKRSRHKNWVVVFKSLATFHTITIRGNERFMQYNSTNGALFPLLNFADNTNKLSYDMSIPIREYSSYINEKILTYRLLSYDLTRIPRGKDIGLLRNMSADKLLNVLPIVSRLMEYVLKCQFKSSIVFNGVIHSAFRLIYLDTIRLFSSYNEGIIKMLEIFYDLDKSNCQKSLEIYKKFILHSEQMTFVIKNASEIGLDIKDETDLAKAPKSIYDSLASHIESMDVTKCQETKINKITGQVMPILVQKSGKSSDETYMNISDSEKKLIIEEEKFYLSQFENKRKHEAEENGVVTLLAPTTIIHPELNIKSNEYEPTKSEQNTTNRFNSTIDCIGDIIISLESSNSTPPPPKANYNPFLDPDDNGSKSNIFYTNKNYHNFNSTNTFDHFLGSSTTNNFGKPPTTSETEGANLFNHPNGWMNGTTQLTTSLQHSDSVLFPTVDHSVAIKPIAVESNLQSLASPLINSNKSNDVDFPFFDCRPYNAKQSTQVDSSTRLIGTDLDLSLATLAGNLVLDHGDKMKKYESQLNLKTFDGRQINRESVIWSTSENNKAQFRQSGLSTSVWSLPTSSSSEYQLQLQKSNSILLV